MAAIPRVSWFSLNCFDLLFYLVVFALITSTENAPRLRPNNATHRDYPSPLVSRPLPVSSRLPTPAAGVGSMCPCDEHNDACDSNCCCDADCGDQVALFTGCSVTSVGGSKRLCSRDVARYSLGNTRDGYSKLQSSVRRETSSDLFCIHSQNVVGGFSHPPPELPTDSSFDSLFQQFTSFLFSSRERDVRMSSAEGSAFSGYQYGDIMVTIGERGERGRLWLSSPGVSAHCVDTNPAAFLVEQRSRCSRHLDLRKDCSTLPTLNMASFTSIQMLAGWIDNASVVPMEVTSVILQSVEGTQSELQVTAGENLHPRLLNQTLCSNVVLKAVYVVKYTPAGKIVNVMLSLVIGFIHEAALPLLQEFQIAFVQDEATVHYSGNPGYAVGLPLVSGTMTADGITRSINPRDTMSVLYSAADQDCLRNPHQRSPILFGVDFVSGCTLRLEENVNCSLVSQTMLRVLRGSNYPQYVASSRNSPLDAPQDWLPIRSNFHPGGIQGCSIPVSFHLEMKWTKYGSLVNPQAQLVSIQEIIQTGNSSLALLSGGTNIVPVSISVSFVAVSAGASPVYRAKPTVDATLPSNFFYPLV
ncbi:hypothetical protein fugu_005228 [Takifugu bimaculatus]|uniref:Uncharacterized protein n=1 Tax=Takifugu bimaculatus TaxID=433685 RepID=A0A4Z2B952_9TELE|nr:hypothetical protein fugu_005228 [Takifugu bimaculatus]